MKLLNCLSNFAKIWLVCLLYDLIYVLFVELQKFKMAAIMAANMAAITTTKPYNLWTAWPIMLTFCWYINYMILHRFHLLSYKNLRWPLSWLPIWPPLQLQNPITCEPLDQLCSNFVYMSTIWSCICSIGWIQDGRHHGILEKHM